PVILAPEGAVAKITGKEGLSFTGRARVYKSEESCLPDILNGKVKKGDVVVIRYEGPRGGPGMWEMLSPTSAIMGRGLGKDVALITDGRFSGGSHGFVVGHITPEAANGGLIGLLEKGDMITIDAEKNELNVAIDDETYMERYEDKVPDGPKETRGVLAKYAKLVSSASLGAVTDRDLG
ncbi:MAG: dihydroxy-acid dehydratase, partial [Verrucomicrobiota bacterium]